MTPHALLLAAVRGFNLAGLLHHDVEDLVLLLLLILNANADVGEHLVHLRRALAKEGLGTRDGLFNVVAGADIDKYLRIILDHALNVEGLGHGDEHLLADGVRFERLEVVLRFNKAVAGALEALERAEERLNVLIDRLLQLLELVHREVVEVKLGLTALRGHGCVAKKVVLVLLGVGGGGCLCVEM